jgi:hypothetical protein
MRRFTLPVAVLAAAAIAVGCDQDLSPTGTGKLPTAAPFTVGEPECHTITFDDQGFVHGSIVTTLTTGFGFNLTVTVQNDPNNINNARTYDTDHQGPPDEDLQWSGPGARCAACNGLGNVLVIEGYPSFAVEGDSPDGGDVVYTGFAGNGTFYLEEYKALDQESTEGAITASVDGNIVGASSGLGDGTVETVTTLQTPFTTSMVFSRDGSGATDDIKICRVPEENGGGEGCTPGYWKQEHHFDSWVGYAPTDYYDVVFGIGPHITLLAALQYQGGGNYGSFLRHSVAALLNSTSISYDLSTAEVIQLVQDTFTSGDFASGKDTLEGFNEETEDRICPLN